MEVNYVKKNNISTIIIIILIFAVGTLIGYIIGDKVKDTKEGVDETEKTTESQSISLDINKVCGIATKESCIQKFKLNGKDSELKLITEENDVDKGHYNYVSLEVDKKNIFKENMGRIGSVSIIDDIFVVDTYCINCGGNSASFSHTKVIDINGSKLLEFFDQKFDNNFEYESYIIKDKDIIITASGVGYWGDYEPSFDCSFKKLDTGVKGVMGNNFVNGSNYDKYSKEVAKTEYKISYLGGNKLSSPKKIRDITFGELYTKEHCIEEYKKYEVFLEESEGWF